MEKHYLVYCSDEKNDLVMSIEFVENKLVFNYGENYTKEEAERFLSDRFFVNSHSNPKLKQNTNEIK